MNRLKYSLFAATGVLVLAFILTIVGPKRVMATLGFTPVRDVDQPARQPFATTELFSFSDVGITHLVTVPPNKRLVIEAVSYRGSVLSGQRLQVFFEVTTGGNTVIDYLVPTFVSSFKDLGLVRDLFSDAHPTRLYADPGTDVVCLAERFGTTSGNGKVSASITGHFVDLP